jgi:hypothetical protein
MIKAIVINNLRNAEYIQFIKDFSEIVLDNSPTRLNVQAQYDKLQQGLAATEALYKQEQGSTLTEVVTAKDARRDKAITGFALTAEGFTYHFNADLAKHAGLLSRAIKQYGSGIARENYQAETAIIDNLLGDFNSQPQLQAAIEALGLKDWKDELAAANADFNAAYLLRTRQLGSVSKDTLFNQRQLCNSSYYQLRDFIGSYFTINNGTEPYAKTSDELNALIDQYNTLLAGRGGSGRGEQPDAPAE